MAELGGSGEHDYTLHPAYRQVERELKPSWSDPYVYATDSTRVELSTMAGVDGKPRLVSLALFLSSRSKAPTSATFTPFVILPGSGRYGQILFRNSQHVLRRTLGDIIV